jgi:WD40 repeat protein
MGYCCPVGENLWFKSSLTKRHIVSGSEDGSVRAWDRDSGEQLRWYWGHLDWFGRHEITAVAVDPKGSRARSASRDKTVRLWELQ